MPQQGITFNGVYLGLPGVYYADDVSAVAPNSPPVTPPLLFVGYGFGPKPKTPVTFTNPQDLLNALRGAPAAAFVEFFATPSPSLNGAQYFTFIDASTNTQSSAAMLASGGGTYATMTSVYYGPPSNLMQFQVAAGSIAGIKLTITDGYANTQVVGDNLSVPFQMAYVGAASGGATYTATSGTFVLTSPTAGESVTFPLGTSQIALVSDLISAINGTGFYLAQGLSATNGQLPATKLSPVSTVALAPVSGGAAVYTNVRAYLNDIPFFVNQFASTFATAVSGASATDIASWLPVANTPTFFSGARGVPPTNNDYAAALNVGLTTPAWAVFCDSNASAVQALLAQHCLTASNTANGSWRRGFTGSSIGDSVTLAQQTATGINTKEMNYLYPGIYRTSTSTGLNTLFGGLYAAAAAAAMACGNPIPTPLTNKALLGTGTEAALTQSQQINLQNSGVMVVTRQNQTNLPKILSDVTTWQVDANVMNTASQEVACRFWLAYSVVNAMQPYVGTIAAPVQEVLILKALIRTLNALLYTGGSSSGVLVSWDRSSLTLNYNGTTQVAAIQFNAVLVGQNRYITIFVPILPLNIFISAASIAA